MKYIMTALTVALFTITSFTQSVVGTWKTISDEDGKVKSHVEITEADGVYTGKVVKLINPDITKCTKCKGSKKGQDIEGMTILWDLKKDGKDSWDDGTILDPKKGKEYSCSLTLKDANTLDVRGYIGFSLIGRSQTWYRVD